MNKIYIQWEDQHRQWVHLQTVHHLPSAVRIAMERTKRTGKRHRLLDESKRLLDLFN